MTFLICGKSICRKLRRCLLFVAAQPVSKKASLRSSRDNRHRPRSQRGSKRSDRKAKRPMSCDAHRELNRRLTPLSNEPGVSPQQFAKKDFAWASAWKSAGRSNVCRLAWEKSLERLAEC